VPRRRGGRRLRRSLYRRALEGRRARFPADHATPDAVGAIEGKRVADGLRTDNRPSLVLWADSDPVLPFSVGERISSELNLTPPRAIADASHFLQEDAGPEIGRTIADWLG
jgi:pimeloyl-ACP methyl ester carboxylesterase